MKKINFIIFLLIYLFFNLHATFKENILSKFNNIDNLSFEFEQNINEKNQKGKCIIKYPKKIYCEYYNLSKKILVSNGKHLVIKNKTNNQYYIYPIKKTAFNLILDKNYLLTKMKEIKPDLIDKKYYRFKFKESEHEINIFFDLKTHNLIGWQNIDIYQNLVITYIFNIKENIKLNNNQFKLPKNN